MTTAARTLDALLACECRELAALLAARGKEGLGVQRWDEVAVLAPRIKWLEMAAPIFARADLPVSLLSQKRTQRELPAFAWPAALLHVLVHPWDRFELIGVLRELFAISDLELARWHRRDDGGLVFWPHLPAGLATAPEEIRAALETLHALRAAMPGEDPGGPADQPTLGRFVDFVLGHVCMGARLEAIGEEPAAVAGALNHLRLKALTGESDGVALRSWVRALVESLDGPPPLLPGAPDSIQFLTCQKSKGLEWPVVIPLGLGRELRAGPTDYPLLKRDGLNAAEVHFSVLTIPDETKDRDERRRHDEFQRLLYVTLTRTQRLLVLLDGSRLYGAADKPHNFLGFARWPELTASERWDALFANDKTPRPKGADAAGRPAPPPAGPEARALDESLIERAAKISRRIPKRILPSSLALEGQPPAVSRTVLGEDEDLRRILAADASNLEDAAAPVALLGGGGGKNYGNWWHETLESYPWTGADAAGRVAYLAARLAAVPSADGDVTARAEFELARFSGSRFHTELLGAGSVFLAEAPFSFARSADEWLEGIIDLVVITESGDIWIVDWKTDRRRAVETEDELLARLAEKYGPQLAAYAELFERGVSRKVTRRLLYATPLGRAVDVGTVDARAVAAPAAGSVGA